MVTKQLSIAIVIGICVGLNTALKTFAAEPAPEIKVDLDQVFAAATRRALYTSTARVRVIAFGTPSPFCRNLRCSPTASQWHPRSSIRS
jgi:hypothetical protein